MIAVQKKLWQTFWNRMKNVCVSQELNFFLIVLFHCFIYMSDKSYGWFFCYVPYFFQWIELAPQSPTGSCSRVWTFEFKISVWPMMNWNINISEKDIWFKKNYFLSINFELCKLFTQVSWALYLFTNFGRHWKELNFR